MLNQVEKNRILNSIKNQSIGNIVKKEIITKKWSIYTCSEVLNFLISETAKKLDTKRKKTTKTISNLIYSLYIFYISILKSYEKILISEEDLNIMLNLKTLYEKNIENTIENDINTFSELYSIIRKYKKIEFLDVKEETEQKEEVQEELPIKEKNSEESEKLKTFKKKNKELKKEIKDLESKLERCVDENTIKLYKKEIESLQSKIKDLNESINTLSSKNQSLESINENFKKQITDISNALTTKNRILEQELNSIREKANNYEKSQNQKSFEEEIDNLVLMYLANNNMSISELLECLKMTFPNITKDSILNSLKRLQIRYILTKDTIINNDFTYKLGKKRNNIFEFKDKNNSIDIIVIADMHIDSNIDSGIKNLNYIYDYAINKNIKTIINLGDIIDSRMYGEETILEKLRLYDELVDKTIEKLPKDDSIKNLILAGNHDRSLLDIGIDVTDRISKNRLDYLNLGSDHALLQFNNSKIGLHHPNRRFDDGFINIENINDIELLKNINDYYKYRYLDRNNIFIDLFGHFHVSKISMPNNYVTVPSLNRDHIQNGAYRIKLYFDSNGNIVNSILIPLIVNNKVIESTSINYQKRK